MIFLYVNRFSLVLHSEPLKLLIFTIQMNKLKTETKIKVMENMKSDPFYIIICPLL